MSGNCVCSGCVNIKIARGEKFKASNDFLILFGSSCWLLYNLKAGASTKMMNWIWNNYDFENANDIIFQSYGSWWETSLHHTTKIHRLIPNSFDWTMEKSSSNYDRKPRAKRHFCHSNTNLINQNIAQTKHSTEIYLLILAVFRRKSLHNSLNWALKWTQPTSTFISITRLEPLILRDLWSKIAWFHFDWLTVWIGFHIQMFWLETINQA